MTNKLTLMIVGLVFSAMMIEPVLAGGMRCGTHVISAGHSNSPSQYEVLKRCGEPDQRYGKTWIYVKSSSVSHTVTFTGDGRLKSIE